MNKTYNVVWADGSVDTAHLPEEEFHEHDTRDDVLRIVEDRPRITAHITRTAERWICRLYEPGGYVWHGQVAHTSFNTALTAEQFTQECRRWAGVYFEVMK